MTQIKKQSVRNAEAVETTTFIPTYEEIIAIPYVQESLRSLAIENSRLFPMMAPYEEDISQEMSILLAQRLEAYDPLKSDIKTFCRMLLETGLMRARRRYATKTQQVISQAIQIETLVETENEALVMDVSSGVRSKTDAYSDDPFFSLEKKEAFKAALASLSPKDQKIAQAIMDGVPIVEICNSEYCCRRYFYRHALPNMRRAFRENYF